MREDMDKVIVERPRYRSSLRGQGKGSRRDLQRIAIDEYPRREGMKQTLGYRTKIFNEHLGPLRRYLHKQVGRPWNKVYAEIRANISRDSVVQNHVHTHVMDYVATQVQLIDGTAYYVTVRGGLQSLFGQWHGPLFYVCPKTGLLKRVPRLSRRQWRTSWQSPDLHVFIDHDTTYFRRHGFWSWVRFEAIPAKYRYDALGKPIAIPLNDALQGQPIARGDAVRIQGRAVIVKEMRPATRDEIRKVCEPLKAPNLV